MLSSSLKWFYFPKVYCRLLVVLLNGILYMEFWGKNKSIAYISGNQLAVSEILTVASTEASTHSSFSPSGLMTLNCQGQASYYKQQNTIVIVADCSVSSGKQILQQRCRIIKTKPPKNKNKAALKMVPDKIAIPVIIIKRHLEI